MKITIEIGPNRVTRFFSRIAYSVKGAKTSWKEYKVNGKSVNPVKKVA